MSADAVPVLNARELIAETLCFAQGVPATVKVNEEFNLSVIQKDATVKYVVKEIDENNNETVDSTSLDTTNPAQSKFSKSGLFAITIKDTAEQYAPWTTTVYVEA